MVGDGSVLLNKINFNGCQKASKAFNLFKVKQEDGQTVGAERPQNGGACPIKTKQKTLSLMDEAGI